MISFRLFRFWTFLLCALAAQGIFAQTDGDLLSQLRAEYAALTTARLEFEQVKKTANTSAVEQADYAEWILQLNRQFAQTCRLVAYSPAASVPADIPCEEYTASYQPPAAIDINAETTDAERTAAIMGKFNNSLGDFDEKLLREQDRVKARKAQTAAANGGGGSASGADGSSEGSAQGESGAEGSEGSEGQDGSESSSADNSQSGQSGNQTDSNNNNTSSGSPSGPGRPSSAPPGTPDGRNDDVIARQLREAAEKETDPELKRKLWEEYRRYKQGQ